MKDFHEIKECEYPKHRENWERLQRTAKTSNIRTDLLTVDARYNWTQNKEHPERNTVKICWACMLTPRE